MMNQLVKRFVSLLASALLLALLVVPAAKNVQAAGDFLVDTHLKNMTAGQNTYVYSIDAKRGEIVRLRLTLDNKTDQKAADVRIKWELGNGLEYVAGSSKVFYNNAVTETWPDGAVSAAGVQGKDLNAGMNYFFYIDIKVDHDAKGLLTQTASVWFTGQNDGVRYNASNSNAKVHVAGYQDITPDLTVDVKAVNTRDMTGGFQDKISNIRAGDKVAVAMYLANTASDPSFQEAWVRQINVRLAVSGNVVTGLAKGTNTIEKSDTTRLFAENDQTFSLVFVKGSAALFNAKGALVKNLPDAVMTTGVNIGDLEPSFPPAQYVRAEFEVPVVPGPQPQPQPQPKELPPTGPMEVLIPGSLGLMSTLYALARRQRRYMIELLRNL